jgi:SAM-dependent methyltransferase
MNSVHKKNLATYASLYKTDAAAYSYEVRVKVESLVNLVPKKQIRNALEIGYGTGDLLHKLATVYKKASITGVEVVDEARKLYRKRYPHDKNVQLTTRDAENTLHLPKTKFDLVIASHVLEHIKNEENFLQQVYQSLTKNGVFLLAVPDWGDFENHLHYRQYNRSILEDIEKRFLWEKVIIKGDGFYLNKMFYKLLWKVPAFKEVGADVTSSFSQNKSGLKTFYYMYGVQILLLMNTIDSFLFSRIDNKPMQWIAVYRKK